MAKIIGMIRYSVKAGFAASYGDPNFSVWKEPYFSQRLAIFKGITLPCFAAQTDKDFSLLVYHSDEMPVGKKQIFAALEVEYPFMHNIFLNSKKMTIPDDMKREKMLTFRIDNDDGVPTDFIKRLVNIYDENNDYYNNTPLTIPQIRKVARIGKHTYKTNTLVYPSNSMGLAYLGTDGRTIMDLGNHALVPYSEKILFLKGIGGLQIISGTNVKNSFRKSHHKQSEPEALKEPKIKEKLLADGYPDLDLTCIPISRRQR